MTSGYAVGALVRTRGREWVVLPGSEDDLLVLRPLGGTDDEVAGVYLPLEKVEAASFAPPSADDLGDFRSARLLRDALRLSVRSSAGPFRSFGKIAVSPRPYQLVPLLMALKLDPVRLLIADDVGVGKTVESCLIAKEMLEQGTVTRLAVLCPPHLAPQWQRELQTKFHIDAEQVVPSTAERLERDLRMGQTIFDRYPYVVVSLDFIKSDRRRTEFVNGCPELVIVDEAHSCADPSGGRGHMQRHELVARLAADPTRHMILVTATPHAGKEDPFRSLLGFLDPSFAELPPDLGQAASAGQRRKLARHLVQRRRGDIRAYLGTETVFPDREAADVTYTLPAEYKDFFEKVLRYCRETVRDDSGGKHRQRVRWWAALGLLRAIGSSPAAAAATLRERARSAGALDVKEADELGRRSVLDLTDDESIEGIDVAPGAGTDVEEPSAGSLEQPSAAPSRRRLNELAKMADALYGPKDHKLAKCIKLIRELLDGGFSPIVFCRFIDTAEYLGDALAKTLPRDVAVRVVTGRLPAPEREKRVEELGRSSAKHVLIATDCLAEGINLQEHFDAVLHYDLSWSPTRHEQREGRVDRFGQTSPKVRVLTYYGVDNPIDGIILSVLIQKHRKIRGDLGIAVPVPVDSNAVLEAILEGLLMRGRSDASIDDQLELFDKDVVAPRRVDLHGRWDKMVDRERKSHTVFAQGLLDPQTVASELSSIELAVGTADELAQFLLVAIRACGGTASFKADTLTADLSECPPALVEAALNALGDTSFSAAFDPAATGGHTYLSRTHPFVDAVASFVLDTALDPRISQGVAPASRAGVVRTRIVPTRTTLLLLRYRFDVVSTSAGHSRPLLAEQVGVLAFQGSPEAPQWLDSDATDELLFATADANIGSEQARQFVQRVVSALGSLRSHLNNESERQARTLLDSHSRVRDGARLKGVSYRVEARPDPDLLGIYIFLPVN